LFFDGGLLDALGMLDDAGLKADTDVKRLLDEFTFSRTVFVFPPWKEICTTDSERDQSFEEAVAVHARVKQWYERCGYDLIEVPRMSVGQHCEFIVGRCAD
jgi:predicted ATPase